MSLAAVPGAPGAGLLRLEEPFRTEGGGSLPEVTVAYETYGELDADGGNAVYVCHALTGSSHASSWADPAAGPGWWEGLIGPGLALDPEHDFIVCANLLGGCYGTTGPASADPRSGEIYGVDFPQVTTRDMVRVQKKLLARLGVQRLRLVIGGSLGGMVVWQWLVDEPDFVGAAVPIAGTPQCSPWVIALNKVARQAILNDPEWQLGRYQGPGPTSGLALARMIAMISYRSDRLFWQRFGREEVGLRAATQADLDDRFQVESYLDHHGRKLVDRFDARAYVYLTRAMDLHDISRGHDGLDAALARVRCPVLAVGIDSDVLYYPHEVRAAARRLAELGARSDYDEIQSSAGHDAFLIEYDQLNPMLRNWRQEVGA